MLLGTMRIAGVVFVPVLLNLAAVPQAAAQAAEFLSTQLRDQGYPCEHAINATRDARRSRPDQAVWVVTCSNATYRMRLTPDMAAHVERLR
jgi:hypothetical protein